jgi:hypothetical protein
MDYYTGTKEQCEEYLTTVNFSENYSGSTVTWSKVIERDGSFYILKHPSYSSSLPLSDLPPLPEQDESL